MQNLVIVGVIGVVIIGGIVFAMNSGSNSTMDADPMVNNMNEPSTPSASDEMDDDMMEEEEGVMVGGAMMLPSMDIVDNAVNASNVTTLVAAVTAADLVETLKSEGPFTVFAPTNAAFEALPDGTVDTLLMAENQADLQDVLTYHVVAGAYTAADLEDGMTLTTVNGAELNITIENGMVMVNGAATVETADVISSNGVTHVIDAVLLPPSA